MKLEASKLLFTKENKNNLIKVYMNTELVVDPRLIDITHNYLNYGFTCPTKELLIVYNPTDYYPKIYETQFSPIKEINRGHINRKFNKDEFENEYSTDNYKLFYNIISILQSLNGVISNSVISNSDINISERIKRNV